jgi:hypothetical protein
MTLPSPRPTRRELIEELNQEILAGNCVALVGAGFTAPVSGTWRDLLFEVATVIDRNQAAPRAIPGLEAWLGRDSDKRLPASDYEAAAQFLRDLAGLGFDDHVKVALEARRFRAASASTQLVKRRRGLLQSIPFRAVLTLNFDQVIEGHDAALEPDVYRAILVENPRGQGWYEPNMKQREGALPASKLRPVIKLHGGTGSRESGVVLAWSDYGRRLHADPAYLTFLRSLMSTRSFLYVGFSFTDAYLNELRRELATLFGTSKGSGLPKSYAILPNVEDVRRTHFERHEGIQVIEYSIDANPPDPSKAHQEFDDILESIAHGCSASQRMREALKGRRVLWLDPQPANNEIALEAMGARDGCVRADLVTSLPEALARFSGAANAGQPYDLVLTHWGQGQGTAPDGRKCSTAEGLLVRLPRTLSGSAPVIVFCAPGSAEKNRPSALRNGAFDLASQFYELFEAIARAAQTFRNARNASPDVTG